MQQVIELTPMQEVRVIQRMFVKLVDRRFEGYGDVRKAFFYLRRMRTLLWGCKEEGAEEARHDLQIASDFLNAVFPE